MVVEVLISTMNNNESLIKDMNIQTNAVVINQTNYDSSLTIKKENNLIKWINVNEKGLSKSRNLAIKNTDSDIFLLADDDLEYVDGYNEIITKSFEQYPEYDVIAFKVIGKNKKFKEYKNESFDVGYIKSMKLSSVELAFRTNSFKNSEIKFDELFGAGAKYYMGEENIVLFDCLRKNLKIRYIPIQISYLTIGDSTWFEGYTPKYFVSTGAKFTKLSKNFSIPLILQFATRKRNLYINDITTRQAIKFMFDGRREILTLLNKKQFKLNQ